MIDRSLTTAREALMAELLQDVDALVRRVEVLDKTLAEGIEKATKDAIGRAFVGAKLNLESVIEEGADKLGQAGREAAAQIGNQLNSGTAQLVTAHIALERKTLRFIFCLAVLALVSGAVGGIVGAKLAGTTQHVGSVEKAIYWFKNNPLQAFDYRTPQDHVSAGRTEAVVRYVQSLQAGFVG